MKKVIAGVVLLVVIGGGIFLAVSKKDSKPSNTNPQSNSPSKSTETNINSPAETNTVEISNFAFTPANITVKKGTEVTWTNKDSVVHTVSGDTSDGPNSSSLSNGDTYSFTFNTAGTFGYHCNPHQSMHGTVTVTK